MAYYNVLTQVGEELIVDLMGGASADYIGWGTGAGEAAKGSTDLSTPATEARVLATRTEAAADKIQWVGTLTADGGKTITNAGVFDAAGSGSPPSGGTPLIVVGNFAGIALNQNDQIQFTFQLEIT